jgi:hypothetical protein
VQISEKNTEKDERAINNIINVNIIYLGVLRFYYLSRFDHGREIRDRKQRMDMGKYSFLNSTIEN